MYDDTALQTQKLKFGPWLSEAEHTISRSQRLPTILNHYEKAKKQYFVSFKLEGQSGVRIRDLQLSKQAAKFNPLVDKLRQLAYSTISHSLSISILPNPF